MPRLTDLERVRARLDRDRAWSAYALGDLGPAVAQWAEWYASPGDEALVLVYRQFATPIVFAIGPPAAVAPLLAEIDEPQISLQVQQEIVPLLAPRYAIVKIYPVWRMMLRPAAFVTPDLRDVSPLGPGDLEALQQLYADGEATGEAPDFFAPGMLAAGMFRGIRDGQVLVAAAGTHLVAPETGICAVGNVYTHRDHRGRGFGSRVTAAVVVEAQARQLNTVVLNVRQHNGAARRVYERLGFVWMCDFMEGLARRL